MLLKREVRRSKFVVSWRMIETDERQAKFERFHVHGHNSILGDDREWKMNDWDCILYYEDDTITCSILTEVLTGEPGSGDCNFDIYYSISISCFKDRDCVRCRVCSSCAELTYFVMQCVCFSAENAKEGLLTER